MHLPGVRNHRNAISLRKRSDLPRLRDAADSIGIELNVIQRPGLQQFAETVEREFVLASGNGNAPVGF